MSASKTFKPSMAAFGLAVAACPGLAFQPSSSLRSSMAEVERPGAEMSQEIVSTPEVAVEAVPASSSAAGAAAAAGTLAAAAVVVGRSRRKTKVARKGLKSSPGFNTLPEFEKKKNGFEGVIGDQPPLGYWDPLGFSKDGDIEKFKRRREVEIKHGRVAMFATMGYITPEYFKLDGYLSPSENIKFSDVPNGLAAISKVPAAGWGQIFAFIGFIELVYNKASPEPGNYGKGVFGLGSLGLSASVLDQGVRSKKLKAELANGRLAMMAIIGMFFQDGLTGSAWGDWANYTDSPLRAFEGELGVQAPVGYWDPLGLAKDGDVLSFKRRRATELKHGRIAMLATMGYMTPELTGKFPGYLSPSTGLKYADIPNGLGAIAKVPALGWAQILAYAGFCEMSQDQETFSMNPTSPASSGDFGLWTNLVEDPDVKAKRQASELANGRLAMMAIIGMFYQDGLTGSAYGDWSLYTDSPLRAFENELGAQPPFGFWDPLGLTQGGSTETFARRRQTEIKHGRISMLATMGYITPEITGKFPGYLSPSNNLTYNDIPNGLGAISKVPAAGWVQIFLYCAFVETAQDQSPGTTAATGDFGQFKFFLPDDEAGVEKKKASELANGRLAMMAITGMVTQDGLTGSAWGDWSLYTDSPLRAFESELGVQAPVGYFDPLGLSKDGDVATFKRRRATELKHGRISMLATMGYITPEITGKLPGYLSPSLGIKYADIPNGLGAISKVPQAGWGQIFTWCMFLEVSQDQQPGTPASEGDFGFLKALVAESDEVKKAKQTTELANGRLAMMAIIGMFYQDGLTGSAWGDWSLYTDSPLRAFEDANGVQAPLGFWDPIGFTKTGDAEAFKRRRETEIKHGRVCMYATIGYIVPEYFRWPGDLQPSTGLKFADIPNGLAAISKVPAGGWTQIVAFLGFYELSVYPYSGEPGDYGKGFLGVGAKIEDAELKKKKLNAEIANGRLAMAAIIGMFFQDGLTGSAWGDWANYTDSPLRAFESERGVQAPVGFFDPLGFTSDGSVEDFKRRRQSELKHGRISMLATMGYITPEITGKFPGYLSTSKGIKFADVPNGLAAIYKIPAAGWAQIAAYGAFCELSQDQSPGSKGAEGDFGLLSYLVEDDEELKTRRQNSELANGRLAMMAIIGMFYQDGLTGSAWGDWSNYTDSILRAFESELGVQAPVGYWDPLGLAKDGDVLSFKRRRATELKHGRIAMLATMGYMTPELTGKFPGYLSPSTGLKYADIPNGLGAIAKVPALGWAQILAYAGFCEMSQDQQTFSMNPTSPASSGDFGLWTNLVEDPDVKAKRQASELANGRLAMMAIIGMFYQDGLTGSAYGDWSLYTDSPLRAFEDATGVQPPLGFWDPLGYTSDANVFDFNRRRETELKHGRVAMFACMGYIAPEYFRFEGYCSPSYGVKFADIPNGFAALGVVPALGIFQIILFAGLIEITIYNETVNGEPGNYGAGNLGLRTLGVTAQITDPEVRKKKLNAELANGRLAMMAIIGMFFQEGLTGSAWGDWANYTDSPLRAFENELGVQAPVGFWDPVGFTADGNVASFKRRRSVELKHGRISMLACMGYMTPEITGKFPGYLSPSMGLKFADVPSGLAAISKVPALGWAQIAAYMGAVDVLGGFNDYKTGTPGDYGWKALTSSDPAEKQVKLAAELANGRLAMTAILAMFFQNGTTGTTGPEMWLPSNNGWNP